MSFGLALGEREVLLRCVLGRRWCGGVGGGGRLEGEEALEDALGLPFSCVGEIYPHIHTTGPAKCRVEALNVICGRKQKSGRGGSEIEGNTQRKKVNIPPLGRCHTIKAVQKPTQTQRRSIGGLRSSSLFRSGGGRRTSRLFITADRASERGIQVFQKENAPKGMNEQMGEE